jgi:hypothetical protein
MELEGLLSRETVENAFLIGLLLTGSMKQAEDAVVESIDCSDTSQVCGERIFRSVIHSSLSPRLKPLAADMVDEDSAAMLPLELRRVLHLPRELRECFVLRMLIGLPGESCAWLLQVDPAEIRSRLQKAVTKLAGFCGDDVDTMQREVGQGAPEQVLAMAV